MLDQKKIGEQIAELRKSKNLTQAALAEMLNVTHQAVSKWENGAALPDIEVLLKMRELFGISIDELLDCKPKADAPPPPCENAGETYVSRHVYGKELRIPANESCEFLDRVAVETCIIDGKARFKAEVHAENIEVSGRADFENRVECENLKQRGQFTARGLLKTESAHNTGVFTAESEFRADDLENSGALTLQDRVTADSIRNTGAFTVLGDMTTDSLRNTGALTCEARTTADSIGNSGAITIHGQVTADDVENSGCLKCKRGLSADSIRNHGALTVEGHLGAGDLRSTGDLRVEGNAGAGSAELSGRLHIAGELGAGEVQITLSDADCSVGEIKAACVVVKRHPESTRKTLTIREIRSADADLSGVECEFVKSTVARVGEGCRIKRLECVEKPEIAAGARVGEVVVTARNSS